jgi:hypothetical protein
MRRAIAVVLCFPVGFLTVYFALCVFAGRLIGADEALGIAGGKWLLVFFGAVGVIASCFEGWAAKRRPVVLFACVLVVVAGAFVFISAPDSSSPEDALQEARAAYARRDLASFKSYVDVNAVLGDGIDQIIVSPLSQSAAQSGSGGGILAAGMAVAAASWKQVYLPELSEQVEQFVVSGSLPNQSQDDAFVTALGSEILRMLAASQLTYEGIAGTQKLSDSFARVTVRVRMSSSGEQNSVPSPVLLTFRMRSDGSHWRIVGIENLPELAKQLLD